MKNRSDIQCAFTQMRVYTYLFMYTHTVCTYVYTPIFIMYLYFFVFSYQCSLMIIQQRSAMPEINSTVLQPLLLSFLQHFLNSTGFLSPMAPQNTTIHAAQRPHAQSDGVIYIILVVGMFSFFTFSIMLRFIRSKKLEGSNDLYHQYIAHDWAKGMTPSRSVAQALYKEAEGNGARRKEPVIIYNPTSAMSLD